jgi:hypothetical protein
VNHPLTVLHRGRSSRTGTFRKMKLTKEKPVTKTALLKKIETILDELERTRAWGTIEIEVREGQPTFIRRTLAEKIAQENNRGQQATYR